MEDNFVADLFAQDQDIEDDFEYTYGAESRSPVFLSLRGVAREFGQTSAVGETGLTIWRGAEELCRYLYDRRPLLAGKSSLELGAGLGLVGLLAAHIGTYPNVVTDGDHDTLLRLCANAEKNGFIANTTPSAAAPATPENAFSLPHNFILPCPEGRSPPTLSVQRLLWGEPDDIERARTELSAPSEGFEVILAADVIYEDESIAPLVATVCALLRRSPDSIWLLSFARRNVPVDAVIAEASKNGLSCRRVEDFSCATSGEAIFELMWRDLKG